MGIVRRGWGYPDSTGLFSHGVVNRDTAEKEERRRRETASTSRRSVKQEGGNS